MHKVFAIVTLFIQSWANSLNKVVVQVDIQYIAISFGVQLGISQLPLLHCCPNALSTALSVRKVETYVSPCHIGL